MFYRKIKFSFTFECRTTSEQDNEGNDTISVDQSDPIPVEEQTITFESKEEAYRLTGELNEWAKLAATNFAHDYATLRCPGPTIYASDWKGYVDSVEEGECYKKEKQILEEYEKERNKKLLKDKKKKENAKLKEIEKLEKEKERIEKERQQLEKEQKIEESKKRLNEIKKKEIEIEAIKEDKQIPVVVKRELTGTDIAHIHSAEKKINKINEVIQEQTKYLNIALGAIERHEESGRKDLLLGAIIDRDKASDMIKIQNEKIKRLEDSILKMRGI